MPWITRQFPLYASDNWPDCRCGKPAVARFTSTWQVVNGQSVDRVQSKIRTIVLCNEHAAEMRQTCGIAADTSPVPEAPSDPQQVPAGAGKVAFAIPKDATVSMCSTCGESIVWIVTAKGRRMPVDAFGDTRGVSHFASCPQADQHRQPRTRKHA
jgi:hypothetical protein